jgi:predicted ATPase
MIISHVVLKNWRNFRAVDVPLSERVFVVGPNASGKSNFLDIFRFLRDLARSGGGLQEAVKLRGGVSKIRCLAARSQSDIEIETHITDDGNKKVIWRYAIGFTQTGGGVFDVKAKLKYEKVWDANNKLILNRPGPKDEEDNKLLEYTHLEQPTSNVQFREIAEFFQSIQYLHVIPQLLRAPSAFQKSNGHEDFYGRDFIEKISKTNVNTRKAFLKKINDGLKSAVPQFVDLDLVKDEMGVPHLEVLCKHWRPKAGKQREDQFSDGTLRLVGLLWALQDGNKPILLEEPELSLHPGIVNKLAEIIARLQKKKTGRRQVLLTTHSYELLTNKGIGGDEVLMLIPTDEGTEVRPTDSDKEIMTLLNSGLSVADAVIPVTMPKNIDQLPLQFEQ